MGVIFLPPPMQAAGWTRCLREDGIASLASSGEIHPVLTVLLFVAAGIAAYAILVPSDLDRAELRAEAALSKANKLFAANLVPRDYKDTVLKSIAGVRTAGLRKNLPDAERTKNLNAAALTLELNMTLMKNAKRSQPHGTDWLDPIRSLPDATDPPSPLRDDPHID